MAQKCIRDEKKCPDCPKNGFCIGIEGVSPIATWPRSNHRKSTFVISGGLSRGGEKASFTQPSDLISDFEV